MTPTTRARRAHLWATAVAVILTATCAQAAETTADTADDSAASVSELVVTAVPETRSAVSLTGLRSRRCCPARAR